MRYIWHHGIDIEQDAVIEAAIVHWKKITGAKVDKFTMLKIIIMKYGKELDMTERELKTEKREHERKHPSRRIW